MMSKCDLCKREDVLYKGLCMPCLGGCYTQLQAEIDALITENNILREAEAHNLNEIERLKEALSEKGEYGYSQFTVDALSKERDKLQAEIERLKEENESLRDRIRETEKIDPGIDFVVGYLKETGTDGRRTSLFLRSEFERTEQ